MPVERRPDDRRDPRFLDRALDAASDAYGTGRLVVSGDALGVDRSTSRVAVVVAGGRRFVLKQVPWYAQRPRQLRTSHAWQRALQRHGLPVPAPLPTLGGDSWLSFEGAVLVLMPHVEGEPFAGDARQCAAAGRALAALHACPVHLPDALGESYPELVADHLALARDGGDARRLRLLKELSAVLRDAAGAITGAPCAVHGDFSPGNVLFGPDGSVAAIVDFDNCDVGVRVRDVAEAALTFCALRYEPRSSSFMRPLTLTFDEHRAERLLGAYATAAHPPVGAAEAAGVDVAATAVFVELMALGLLRGDVDASRDGPTIRRWLHAPPRLARLLA